MYRILGIFGMDFLMSIDAAKELLKTAPWTSAAGVKPDEASRVDGSEASGHYIVSRHLYDQIMAELAKAQAEGKRGCPYEDNFRRNAG